MVCDLLKSEFLGKSGKCFLTTHVNFYFFVLALSYRRRFLTLKGIVYCLSQKDTESLTEYLSKEGISAAFYHANVDSTRRERNHIAWLDGQIQVFVLFKLI